MVNTCKTKHFLYGFCPFYLPAPALGLRPLAAQGKERAPLAEVCSLPLLPHSSSSLDNFSEGTGQKLSGAEVGWNMIGIPLPTHSEIKYLSTADRTAGHQRGWHCCWIKSVLSTSFGKAFSFTQIWQQRFMKILHSFPHLSSGCMFLPLHQSLHYASPNVCADGERMRSWNWSG